MQKGFLAWLMSMMLACGAFTQEEKPKELKGVIRTLDLKTGTLTLHQLQSDKQHLLSLISKEVPVIDPLGRPIKLGDLREELRVTVKLRNDADVVGMRVDGPYVHGLLKSVDAAGRRLVVKDVFAEKTMSVPEATPVVVQGKPAPLEQLKAGDAVQMLYTIDKKSLLQINTGKGIAAKDPYLRLTRYYGILVDLDHASRSVQIFVQSTDAGVVKTYTVSPDAYLRTQYHLKPVSEVGFDQFARWLKVYYFVDRDTGRIVNIDADLPVMVRRKVLKLNAKERRLTIEDELREKSLDLASDLRVLTPKGEGKLGDVAPQRIVNCGLSMDRTRVQVLYLWDR